MTTNKQAKERPRVFISYAQFAESHSARVLALAQALREHGIDVELDQFHRNELLHWPRWSREQLHPDRYDWVLKVCTATYRERLEGRVDPQAGRGVFWEGALIEGELYDAKGNRRVVPILLDDEPEGSIPDIVRGWSCFRVRGLDHGDPGYEALYRLLTGQPAIAKAPLGPPVALRPGSPAGERGHANQAPPLPAREAELDYLARLLGEIERKARLYAPLRGHAGAYRGEPPARRRRALAHGALVGAQRMGGGRRAAGGVSLRRLHPGDSLAPGRPARGRHPVHPGERRRDS